MSRPTNKTILNIIKYLNDIGLSIYGPNIDVDTGELFDSLRDYDPESVVKFRELYEKDCFIDRRS